MLSASQSPSFDGGALPGGAGADEAGRRPNDTIDPERFTTLYEQHREGLFAFCVSRTRDRDTAEDIVQDVFAKAFAARARFDTTRPFWPWLASIAARECIDVQRRRANAAAVVATLAHDARLAARRYGDVTAATVVRRAEDAALHRSLATLPIRQRTALQLFAIESWSYAEIGAQLGYSIDAVKALIARARTRLRDVGAQALAGIGIGMRRIQVRLHRATGRAHVALAVWTETLALWVQNLGSPAAALTMAVVAVAGPAPGSAETTVAERTGAATARTAAPASVVAPAVNAPPPTVAHPPSAGPSSSSPVEPALREYTGKAERAANDALVTLLGGLSSGSTDTTMWGHIVVSPRYHEDHTVFMGAVSTFLDVGPPLLMSTDGGASWTPRRAAGLGGLGNLAQLTLSPAYPHDDRLFAVTVKGLMASRDRGDTFETLAPVGGAMAAFSPVFGTGDASVLLVGSQLQEYHDDTGTVELLTLGGDLADADDMVVSATYAADYPRDPTLFVATQARIGSAVRVSRCTRAPGTGAATVPGASSALHCTAAALPGPLSAFNTLALQPGPPGSEVLWVTGIGSEGQWVSTDGGRSFRSTRSPFTKRKGCGSGVWGLAAVPSATGRSAVVAQQEGCVVVDGYVAGPPLLRTDDAGRTWTPLPTAVPGSIGTRTVAVTPTGRIIASNWNFGGSVCSEDGGRSWARLCPTPDTG